MQNIRTNIQALNRENPAPFSDYIIHNYYTYLRKNCIYLNNDSKHYVRAIPLDQVIGIAQGYVDDSTWGQCLEGRWLKRLKRNLTELENNPQYYLSEVEQPVHPLSKLEITTLSVQINTAPLSLNFCPILILKRLAIVPHLSLRRLLSISLTPSIAPLKGDSTL